LGWSICANVWQWGGEKIMDNNQQDGTPEVPSPSINLSEQEGIGALMDWTGSLAPVFGSQDQDARPVSTYNAPPNRDGKPTAGYGNQSGYGYSNQ